MVQPTRQIVVIIWIKKVCVHIIQQTRMLGYQLVKCERLLHVSGVEMQDWKMIDCTFGCLSESSLTHLRDNEVTCFKFWTFQYSVVCRINCCTGTKVWITGNSESMPVIQTVLSHLFYSGFHPDSSCLLNLWTPYNGAL